MRVAFLGFGLIGGSIARALRAREPGRWSVAAWTPSGRGPSAGADVGAVDLVAGSPQMAVEGADLVILAAPAPACVAILDDLAGPLRGVLRDDAVITDVASSKAAIVLRATALGLRFVGGHPMAGRETSGFEASDPELLTDRPWVIVPTVDEEAVRRVEDLARATGARPTRLAAEAHDAAVAAISHLPLLVAVSLVEAVAIGTDDTPRDDWPVLASLVAGGWRDMTRLARGDVAMGTGIVTTNAEPIAPRVRALIAVLEEWLAELERPGGPDADVVAGRLAAAKERLGVAT
ncbi:MAG: prephenate dehydrogenase/arogenate dehydrogenase family protein [Chloroflexota bacterium]|jgi:prephenate dehydrogenase|nr:prephenate dehydrogenase/arogenate dehydrogenase family protein [Chloroflexota bacterium]